MPSKISTPAAAQKGIAFGSPCSSQSSGEGHQDPQRGRPEERIYLGQHVANVVDLVSNFAHFIPSFVFAFARLYHHRFYTCRCLVDLDLLLFYGEANSRGLGLQFFEEDLGSIKLRG